MLNKLGVIMEAVHWKILGVISIFFWWFQYLSTHETGCQPKWASLFDPGKDKLHLESFERSLRKIMEVFPFYSQCFLTLGLSWERWVKVCRPHDAKTLLDRQTQFGLTAIVLLLSVILPAIIFIDYELNKVSNVLRGIWSK